MEIQHIWQLEYYCWFDNVSIMAFVLFWQNQLVYTVKMLIIVSYSRICRCCICWIVSENYALRLFLRIFTMCINCLLWMIRLHFNYFKDSVFSVDSVSLTFFAKTFRIKNYLNQWYILCVVLRFEGEISRFSIENR